MILCCRRPPLNLVFCLILFFCLMGHCHGSRTTSAFKVKPKSQTQNNLGHFFGLLPRRIPIPYSSPSRKHNGIGLTWTSP
ncbi:hypothetical protein Lalb_Chr08g0238521 [Lupinus albus]|uniref:Uncharacterized protein n=1 Tax=Lupinus albus TaxID=3870 RepID=A0A6A4Q427_LUPAL|nr:hypothetical protein Lalb_Chr08g0238521 [Lupinus albus]